MRLIDLQSRRASLSWIFLFVFAVVKNLRGSDSAFYNLD